MNNEISALSKLKQVQGNLKSLNSKLKKIDSRLQTSTTQLETVKTQSNPPSQLQPAREVHRNAVGGMWEEIGELQFNFLVNQGLKPEMKLLDVGCGSLRGGIHFIQYLNSGNYYGIDINSDLIQAGYEQELNTELQAKCPRENLLVNSKFQANLLKVKFNFAIAQSVFTHLPLNSIRRCFVELEKCMNSGGKFYATFFEVSSSETWVDSYHHNIGGIVTHADADPYHYRQSDFLWCIEGLSWNMEYIGNWQHPRNQKILVFTKN
jgi:SAM-dependent methyltransferase